MTSDFELPGDPEEDRAAHIDAWQSSGQSQRTYARVHGIKHSTFNDWVNRPEYSETIETPTIIPVQIRKRTGASDSAKRVLVECNSGAIVQVTPGTPIPWVAELIKAL